MQEVNKLIFSKRKYKYYITFIASFTDLLFCIFTLLPPYLLKKPNLLITEINSPKKINNKSVEFKDEYCDSSKYIIKKDPINSLHNWAYKYDLYCSRKKDYYSAGLVVSLFLGATFANIVFETFPDKYGREKIYKTLSIIEIFLLINLIFDFGIIHLIIIMFFIGINLYLFPLSYVVVEEFVIDDLGIIIGIVNSTYSLSGILVAIWFMTINNLTTLFWIICISLIIFKGKKKECLEVLTNIAKFNNIEEEWNLYQKNNPEIIGLIGSKSVDNNDKNNIGFIEILQIESQKIKFIITLIVCVLTGICYYGIILYLDQMKGDFFLNAILAFLGELIAELTGGKLADIYGRKKMTVTFMYIGSVFFILYDILPEKFSGIMLFFSLMGFAGNFTCLSVLVDETFVTEIRGTVFNDYYILDRIVPIIIKILGLYLNKRIIDIIFILSGLASGFLTNKYFSETLGKRQKDFIYEDEEEVQSLI